MGAKRNRDRRPDEPSFRFDRVLLDIHITRRSGTRSWRQFQQDNGVLTELAENGQVEVLKLFKLGRIGMPKLRAAHARGMLASGKLMADIALRESLWGEHGAFATTLKRMGTSPASRDRYEVSMLALQRKSGEWLGPKATVADLEYVDWAKLAEQWGKSGSDWNRMRAMLSAFCSVLFDDKQHEFRRQLLKKIPELAENERVCTINVEQFWQIVAAASETFRPAYVCLVATGMRWGEYASCTKAHLHADTLTVSVPGDASGRKNAKKTERDVPIAEWLWPWIMAGIPAPHAYKATRAQWGKACQSLGISGVRLHDLRHMKGQLAIQKSDISEVADDLGHTQLSTTRRYVRQLSQSRVAKVVGKALKPKGATPTPRKVG